MGRKESSGGKRGLRLVLWTIPPSFTGIRHLPLKKHSTSFSGHRHKGLRPPEGCCPGRTPVGRRRCAQQGIIPTWNPAPKEATAFLSGLCLQYQEMFTPCSTRNDQNKNLPKKKSAILTFCLVLSHPSTQIFFQTENTSFNLKKVCFQFLQLPVPVSFRTDVWQVYLTAEGFSRRPTLALCATSDWKQNTNIKVTKGRRRSQEPHAHRYRHTLYQTCLTNAHQHKPPK